MTAVPTDIRQAGPHSLAISWQDGTRSSYAVRDLRLACPCASCIDEMSGEKRLNPATVPDDIKPVKIRSVGNYAISIAWSDGHDSGIYSFDLLKELGELA